MRHISYSSMANGLSAEEFAEILKHAREWNEQHAIRGAIAFDGRMVTQILEGPEEVVDLLFLRIQSDPRHTGVVLQSRADIEQSQFDGFGMSRMSPSDLYMIAVSIEEKHGSGDSAETPLFARLA
ncbi:BLUF domain-containing protein [Jiella marina]|uniref:BLUF domain-containing protein n=1 Tax=Jiella sp. LLJ827 TaxID=2917712 RepID=UPI002101182F|nr:BLUF domain-containing protein [Jiella sp. LLJ827]MCQ0987115.1 BLUF domain-containing protein [Jiella sp. LLJ827]